MLPVAFYVQTPNEKTSLYSTWLSCSNDPFLRDKRKKKEQALNDIKDVYRSLQAIGGVGAGA